MSYSSIVEALFDRAKNYPDSVAYSIDGERLTYGRLKEDAFCVAKNLSNKGLKKNDRCLIILSTELDTIKILYAVQLMGAIPVMIDPVLKPELILKRMHLIDCRFAITSERVHPDLVRTAKHGEVPVLIETNTDICMISHSAHNPIKTPAPEDIAFLQFTSGTTGDPRAVVIKHRNLTAFLDSAVIKFSGIKEDDVFVTWVPLHHDLGLVRFVFGPLYWGCPSYLIKPSISHLKQWLEVITDVRGTITHGPDFGYRIAERMVNPNDVDIRSLRFAGSGGEPARYSTIERFEKKFGLSEVVKPGYGLAEATLGVACLGFGEKLRVDSMGNPSCGRTYKDAIEARIVDADGKKMHPGEPGEIAVRGPALSDGYFDPKGHCMEIRKNGWFHTGDIGAMDADGNLYILGRKRAMIKRGGALVIPREIEEIVDQHDDIRYSAAVGCVNDEGVEDIVIIAEIKAQNKFQEKELGDLARVITRNVKDKSGFMPNEIVLVSPHTLPKTLNGKNQYDVLRTLYMTDKLADRGEILFGKRRRAFAG